MSHIVELLKALKDENREIHVRVVRALRELEDPRTVKPLLDARATTSRSGGLRRYPVGRYPPRPEPTIARAPRYSESSGRAYPLTKRNSRIRDFITNLLSLNIPNSSTNYTATRARIKLFILQYVNIMH